MSLKIRIMPKVQRDSFCNPNNMLQNNPLVFPLWQISPSFFSKFGSKVRRFHPFPITPHAPSSETSCRPWLGLKDWMHQHPISLISHPWKVIFIQTVPGCRDPKCSQTIDCNKANITDGLKRERTKGDK